MLPRFQILFQFSKHRFQNLVNYGVARNLVNLGEKKHIPWYYLRDGCKLNIVTRTIVSFKIFNLFRFLISAVLQISIFFFVISRHFIYFFLNLINLKILLISVNFKMLSIFAYFIVHFDIWKKCYSFFANF